MALGLVSVLSSAAVAATGPPPQPSVLWAVAPAGATPNSSNSRTTFSYELAKSGSVTDKVAVYNYSNAQLPLVLYATDGLDTAEGQFGIIRSDQKPKGVGTWVTLVERSVIVPAHAEEIVPFTVQVPAGTSPGDHAGAVVASIQTPSRNEQGQQVLVQQQAAVPMYVRVAGRLQPQLSVHVSATSVHPALSPGLGGLDLTYTVRNVGNIRLAAHQVIDITAPFGIPLKTVHPTCAQLGTCAVRRDGDVPELLPGASVTLHAHVDGIIPAVLVTATVRLQPYSPVQVVPLPTKASGSDTAWMIPWFWLLVLAAIVGLIWWRRSRRAAKPSSPPDASGQPTQPLPGDDAIAVEPASAGEVAR